MKLNYEIIYRNYVPILLNFRFLLWKASSISLFSFLKNNIFTLILQSILDTFGFANILYIYNINIEWFGITVCSNNLHVVTQLVSYVSCQIFQSIVCQSIELDNFGRAFFDFGNNIDGIEDVF